jgi:hypothetical protein
MTLDRVGLGSAASRDGRLLVPPAAIEAWLYLTASLWDDQATQGRNPLECFHGLYLQFDYGAQVDCVNHRGNGSALQ